MVSLLVFLNQNRRRIDVSDDDLFDFVIAVADNRMKNQTPTGHADEVVEAITSWLRRCVNTVSNVAHDMKMDEFLQKCRAAGASIKGSGGSWILLGRNKKSRKISKRTRKIDGPAAKTFVRELGLAEGATGLHFDEFIEGVDASQVLIRRFRDVLDRLAHS